LCNAVVQLSVTACGLLYTNNHDFYHFPILAKYFLRGKLPTLLKVIPNDILE